MKNIHVVPTNKPSRLWTNNLRRRLELDEFPEPHPNQIAKHIYISSDEEIKINDYITDGYLVWQWKDNSSLLGRKKIILTTDQDLIKDGVQAIPDEFLEWFVKNPSCEEVKVEGHIYKGQDETEYKIIIPQEEPKQIKCYCGHTITCDCIPLEEPKDLSEWLDKGIAESKIILAELKAINAKQEIK